MSAVFDFGAFPPEVNSAKMYAGPGSTSLLSAAAAWNGLAVRVAFASSQLHLDRVEPDRRRLARSGVDGYGGRGRAVHGVDEHHRGAGRADREPGDGGRGRVRGRVWDDRAAAGDRGQPDAVGVAGRDEPARAERAGDRGHRGPVRPNVGARRRRDVRLCRTVGDSDQGAVVHHCAADHDDRRACRTSGCDHAGHRHEHAGVVVATDICGAHDAARNGLAGYLHVVVHVRTFRAREPAERRLLRELSTRQLLEHLGTECKHLEHLDVDRHLQPGADRTDRNGRKLLGARRA